mmetsp:Transcript_34312/g.80249  ORF Transcript_34312/g.80249 Transcript_34312/m.80249 type:complete len:686 (-) Transcript_34312:71-2128(-)
MGFGNFLAPPRTVGVGRRAQAHLSPGTSSATLLSPHSDHGDASPCGRALSQQSIDDADSRAQLDEEDLRNLFCRLLRHSEVAIALPDFIRICQHDLAMDLTNLELRRVFSRVTNEGTNVLNLSDFIAGYNRVALFRSILQELHSNSMIVADQMPQVSTMDFDYSRPTYRVHAEPGYIGESQYGTSSVKAYDPAKHGPLHGVLADIRRDIDYSWHTNYSLERSLWQDRVVLRVARRLMPQDRPWIVFTSGTMGAGKGYVMRWLSKQGVFPLENVVRIDPDYFKSVMPEWAGYIKHDSSHAGSMCHIESGFMQELAQEVALRGNQNVWIDGSLQDHSWFSKQFQSIRERFPRYRLAIIYVHCSDETALQRADKRAAETRRFVPHDLLLASARHCLESVKKLSPLVDFVVRIKNESHPWVETCEDNTHSLRPLQRMFQLHKSERTTCFPARLGMCSVGPRELYSRCLHLPASIIDLRRTMLRCVPLIEACTEELGDMLHDLLTSEDVQQEKLSLVLTPVGEVTLDHHSRKIAGIPDDAVYFAYCHGVCACACAGAASGGGTGNTPLKDLEPALLPRVPPLARQLMQSSSFVYLSGDAKVLAVNLLAEPSHDLQHSIGFSDRRPLPRYLGESLAMAGRWVEKITSDDAIALAQATAWVLPGELPDVTHGAIAFQLRDGDRIMFPVVAQS